MEIQLKQRLIGAVVIFTLLIIFLPMLFQNNSDKDYVEQILEPPIPQDIKDKRVIIDKADEKPAPELISDQLTNISPDNKEDNKLELKLEAGLDDSDSDVDIDEPDLKIASENKPKDIDANLDKIALGLKPELEPELEKVKTKSDKQDSIIKSQAANINERITYKVDSKITTGQVFAVKVRSFKDSTTAHLEKNKLLAKGLPAYVSKVAGKYEVFVGPELEFKYIKELAQRIETETNYKGEVLAHDSRWVTE